MIARDTSPLVETVTRENLVRRVLRVVEAASPLDKILEQHDHVRDHVEAIYTAAIAAIIAEYVREMHLVARRDAEKVTAFLLLLLGRFEQDFALAMASAGQTAYGYAENRLSGVEWGEPLARAREFAKLREKPLRNAPKEIGTRLKQSLERAVANKETPLAISRRIDEAARQANEIEGARVAETETQVVYGVAQDAALSAAGFKKKRWISMRDERVRHTHEECDEQGAIPIDGKFVNGLRYPGDPSAPAAEVINCRCWLVGEK